MRPVASGVWQRSQQVTGQLKLLMLCTSMLHILPESGIQPADLSVAVTGGVRQSIAPSSNGKTQDFDSCNMGSTPVGVVGAVE